MIDHHVVQAAITTLNREDFALKDDGAGGLLFVFDDGSPQPDAATVSAIVAAAAAVDATERIAATKRTVAAYADALALKLTSIKPRSEMDGWVNKQAAAFQYLAAKAANPGGNEAAWKAGADPVGTILIDSEIAVTDETWDDIAPKIAARAQFFAAASGAIAGVSRATMNAIDALGPAPSQAQLDAVVDAAKAQADIKFAELLAQLPA